MTQDASNTNQQINRLHQGGRINRAKVIRFWFNDKVYLGHPGDTLASALLANGVMRVARSFKYHRPRGIYSAGCEEPNALVRLERGAYSEPNRRATDIDLYPGLVASSQNCWPSVDFDLGAVNSWFARFLPAGFYNKTFMWPPKLWMFYEDIIRKSAGIGVAPTHQDPDCYDKTHAHCDVLVVGGGAAGLSATLAAGKTGARVILIDEQNEWGGALLDENQAAHINAHTPTQWINEQICELEGMPEVRLLSRTTLTGYYDHNMLVAVERIEPQLGIKRDSNKPHQRLWKIRARQVVLATGSIERPLVFADNDRPGVMLAGALRSYINRYAVLAGRRIIVLTNNDSAYASALDARAAGAEVEIVDVRKDLYGDWVDKARDAGILVHKNSVITAINYRKKIRQAGIMQLDEDGASVSGKTHTIDCDCIAHSGGWTPSVHLFSQSRGRLRYDTSKHCFLPDTPGAVNPCLSAGACDGEFYTDQCFKNGSGAGRQAALNCGFHVDDHVQIVNSNLQPSSQQQRPLWILPSPHPIGQGAAKHFHDLHNDVTIADIKLAHSEGYESVEHLKRYTTTGMGTDQGKTSNINALSVMSNLLGVPISEVGTTTYRPPYTPLTFGAIVGQDRRELFLQRRITPIHDWHKSQGALFEDVGDWKRARYYPQNGEDMQTAVLRECKAVRTSVGMLDASTLGKIDIQGPDATRLLNWVYTNAWDKLKPGHCRYGLMLNEHGMVFDDGVTTCLDENHYHMTTTTGGAARVLNWLEEWLQTEWPKMKVYCTSVTEKWAVMALNGPKSRDLLQTLTDLPLDKESFPFMSMRAAKVAGIPARIFRISFTGELAFEINVPARYGLAIWKKIVDAGSAFDLCVYGTESMHVLRAEKGFIIVGQDTDGSLTPYDLGMDWIVSNKKSDFLGKRSLTRSDTRRGGRKQLVGLLTDDPELVLPEGSHIVQVLRNKPPMSTLGHISSSYYSPNVGRSIAIGLVKDGFVRKGSKLKVPLIDGGSTDVTVCEPVFFDNEGVRARG